jgi:hypothetical protein
MSRKSRKNNITQKKRDNIKRMFDNGESITKIARANNITRNSVYRILRSDFGIEIKKDSPKHLDRVGEKFGYLILKEFVKGDDSRWQAVCRCENCGNESFVVNVHALFRGSTTSCGCRRDHYEKISGRNNVNWTGCGELSGTFWKNLRNRAKKRGQDFDVKIEDAWALYKKQEGLCALSNIPIYFGYVDKNKTTTASLDRIDPDFGYVEGNIQWVHKDVNVMKSVFSQEYFVNVCRLVSSNNGLDNIGSVDILKLKSLKNRYFGDKKWKSRK